MPDDIRVVKWVKYKIGDQENVGNEDNKFDLSASELNSTSMDANLGSTPHSVNTTNAVNRYNLPTPSPGPLSVYPWTVSMSTVRGVPRK